PVGASADRGAIGRGIWVHRRRRPTAAAVSNRTVTAFDHWVAPWNLTRKRSTMRFLPCSIWGYTTGHGPGRASTGTPWTDFTGRVTSSIRAGRRNRSISARKGWSGPRNCSSACLGARQANGGDRERTPENLAPLGGGGPVDWLRPRRRRRCPTRQQS